MFTRCSTAFLLVSLFFLSACASKTPQIAPSKLHTLIVLEERAERHIQELGEEQRLPHSGYTQFIADDGTLNLAAIAAAEPDLIYLPLAYLEQKNLLEEIAPVADASLLKNKYRSPLRQEYLALAALTSHQQQARRTWRHLEKQFKPLQKVLAQHPNMLLLFHEDDAFFVHNGGEVGQILQHLFQADLADSHLGPQRKKISADYLRLVQPQTILLVSSTPSIAKLPLTEGPAPRIIPLAPAVWAQTPLTTATLPALSQDLLQHFQQ